MVIRCVVPGCRSTSSKGFLLKRFPRDSERRDIWYASIPKHNWEPTDNTYICEIHFEDQHWEQNRVDRLKSSAVPTLFTKQSNYVKRRQRLSGKVSFLWSSKARSKPEKRLSAVRQLRMPETYRQSQISLVDKKPEDCINRNINIKTLSMENRTRVNLNEDKNNLNRNLLQTDIKEEMPDTYVPKKDTKRSSSSNIKDEKDLLIAQLQEQVAKQRECISHYESIVQLMNYRLMKLKKVLKAHHLLGELD